MGYRVPTDLPKPLQLTESLKAGLMLTNSVRSQVALVPTYNLETPDRNLAHIYTLDHALHFHPTTRSINRQTNKKLPLSNCFSNTVWDCR